MLKVFIFLFACWGMASCLPKKPDVLAEEKPVFRENAAVLFVLLAVMICFSGLRTRMNDTATYFYSFLRLPDTLAGIAEIDWSLGANPGFKIYQIVLRSLGFTDASQFIFTTAIFVTTSYILFLRKYSCDFGFTVFLLIASTTFAFTMGAMKQTIAISIGIWAVDALLRGKKVDFALILLLAATFHPYIIVFGAALLLKDEVWSKRTMWIVFFTVLSGSAFTMLVGGMISAAETLGDEYSLEEFGGAGVSAPRLLVYMVVPVLSYLYKKRLAEKKSEKLNLCINFSVIAMCFMILASFGGANLMGRMANYFDLFNCLSMPFILYYGIDNEDTSKLMKLGAIPCYCLFYFTYFNKYVRFGILDFYGHISLFQLLGFTGE